MQPMPQQTPGADAAPARDYRPEHFRPATHRLADPGDETGAGDAGGGSDDSLDEAARTEGDYLRARLRDELGREPTEAELNEWLRQHTEGY
ncbi:MAG: hypothetical protein LC800_06235 [Acidobacteria bacterium]|nr:hypothetical protein [Acidobacteriota bacterium]